VISLAVAAAGWVGSVHPEITPPSNFHHLRDTTLMSLTIFSPGLCVILLSFSSSTPQWLLMSQELSPSESIH